MCSVSLQREIIPGSIFRIKAITWCDPLCRATVQNQNAQVNENTIKDRLSQKFTTYKIIQWNKNDIRDKVQKTIPEKNGYFTDQGQLKPVNDLDDFEEKIQSIKDYFTHH